MADVVLTNARIILPRTVLHGHLVLRDGLIAEIGDGRVAGLDMGGDYLGPGLVELHTDNLERHIHPRPGVDWPHDAAILAHDGELAANGITTVFDAMRIGSIDGQSGYGRYARGLSRELAAVRKAGLLRISHHLHLRAEICSETLIDELAAFDAEDRVGLVSLMDHTPGQRQFRDLGAMRRHVRGKRGIDDATFDAYARHKIALSERLGQAHQAAALDFARRVGAVMASHDDTTPEQVAQSAAHGITLAEFPTTAEAARACRVHGQSIIMGAPNLIRGASHSGNVGAGDLAAQDLLDIVSSDYVPAALLASAIRLSGIWNDLPRAIATVTATPARAAGLDDRGRIAPGLRADLIRFALPSRAPVMRETWVEGRRVA
ncbi:alpha-D-ribose 1-methylphosphonate 5-triphosphate diphosphatase [Paracoccus tegillarcae]|uniref:Phosphonate metabolism protein PhnM n=1 Tax=Paracoccus tegillarcae TaxID=1529068 RepID=A0A2K9EQG5_9RHOB|nr:alpha-D-ribose 1-methylphosphonate 5-triphosphate diphosphatase [Paracoccus tegillarcae]AUH33915.1 phosphonate metabolism protein PhnM [Paracoccus tegillarcae]